MGNPAIDKTIEDAKSVEGVIPEQHKQELGLLLKDLEEAQTTLFVRTAEAKPMVERCANGAQVLRAAAEAGDWNEAAEKAWGEFERAVTKLRNTILVRTQRAT